MKVSMRVWVITIIFSVLILGLFGTLDDAFAESFTSAGSGDYNSASTWKNSEGDPGLPGVADDKSINFGHTVTVSGTNSNSGLIQNGGTLNFTGTFTNTGFVAGENKGLINFGTVTISGTYNNNGLFENQGGTVTFDTGSQFFNNFASGNAHFHNEGGTVTVKGTLTNSGDLHQLTNGIMTIKGTLTNTGTNAVFDNRAGATLNNDDGIIDGSLSNIFNKLGGKIDNTGTINNNITSTLTNDAIINNLSGGIINNSGGNIINNDGATINNNTFATITLSDITNSIGTGLLRNNSGGTITANGGGFANISTGVINNSGTLSSNAASNTEGIEISNSDSGNINNLSGGTLTTNGGLISNKSSGIITNFFGGTITINDGAIDNFANSKILNLSGGTITITNTGEINNNSNGTIDNSGTIKIEVGGFITNSGGTITNLSGGIIIFPNTGEINDNSLSVINNTLDGTITNSGTITINDGLLNNIGGSNINNLSGGTITMTNTGRFSTNISTVTNSGTITNTVTNLVNGIPPFNNSGEIINNTNGTIDNFGIFTNEFGGTTNNLGTIINRATGTLDNQGIFFNPGTITNCTGGTIINAETITGNAPVDESCPMLQPTITGPIGGIITTDTVTLSGTSLANATIEIFDGETSLGTATADANGDWTFTTPALTDGEHIFTATGNDGVDTSTPSTPITITVNTTLATVSGTVYADTNDNGIQDGGETGIAGVTVILVDGAGVLQQISSFTETPLPNATTDTNGTFTFAGVEPGTLLVQVAPVPALHLPATGFNSFAFPTVTSGQSLTQDFPLVPVTVPATVTGTVFADTNNNGIQDPGELGLEGVTVFVVDFLTLTQILPNPVTDADGVYTANGVLPDTVLVQAAPIPDGFLPSTGHNTFAFPALVPGVNTVDFPLAPVAPEDEGTITIEVFDDTNSNGVKDAGEVGVEGAVVFTFELLTQVADVQVTDTTGITVHTGLIPDVVLAQINAVVLPAGFTTITTSNGGAEFVTLTPGASVTVQIGLS